MPTLDFGSYVRELRKSCGLGLREAAVELGMAASYLSRIETNSVPPPSNEILAKMARVFQVPLSDLANRLTVERSDVSSLDPVAAALYRLAMSAPAADRIQVLERAVEQLDLPPEKKSWWNAELNRLREQMRLTGGSGLLREHKGVNDLYDQYCVPRRLPATMIEQMAISKLRAFLRGDLSAYVPPTPIEDVIEFAETRTDIAIFGKEIGGSFPDGSPRVLGRCRWKIDERLEIGIDERLFEAPSDSPARRRGHFTLGHEYFHAIEHLPRMRQLGGIALNRNVSNIEILEHNDHKNEHKRLRTNEDWREYQANTFSAAILMPAFAIRKEFQSRFGEDICVVPPSALKDVSRTLAEWSDATNINTAKSLSSVFDVNPKAMAIRLETLGLVVAERNGE